MPSQYHLKIITPRGVEYEANVTHTRLPDEKGYVGVLAHHAPFITSCPGGGVDVRLEDGLEKKFYIGSGFFEVVKNEATFLVDSFESEPAQKKKI